MADTITLGTLNLNDGTNFRIDTGAIEWGAPDPEAREVAGYSLNRQIGGQARGLVRSRLPLKVLGASIDAILANVATLRAALPGPGKAKSATLTVKRDGAAAGYQRTATVLYSPTAELPHDEIAQRALQGRLVLELVREPYFYGSAVTLLNASAVTAPCIVDLGTLTGDFQAPLTIEIEANTTDFHSVYVGRLAPGSALTMTDLKRECETGSWSGGSPGTSNPTGSSGASARYNTDAGTWSTAQYADTTLDAGNYLLIGRGLAENVADDSNVYIRRAHDDAVLGTYKWDGNTTWQLAELSQNVQGGGVVRLPNRRVRGAGASNLKVQLIPTGPGGTGRAAFLDYVTFVPVSWGFFRWHPSAAATDLTKLRVQSDGVVYQDDAASFDGFRGRPIEALGSTKLYVVAETVSPTATCGLKITAAVTPRWAGV